MSEPAKMTLAQIEAHQKKHGFITSQPAKKKPAKMKESPLAIKFELLWHNLGGQPLTPEHRFHPTRKWRFDYAHLPTKTAIEIDGGVHSAGRHTRGSGFIADCEKLRAATFLHWRILRLPTGSVTGEIVSEIIEFIHTLKN